MFDYGQGLAGAESVGHKTTALYSCMGIAFVNSAKRFGGLYHYPAETIKHETVRGTITIMYNDIKPDLIYLTPAAKNPQGAGSSHADIVEVGTFLQVLHNNRPIEMQAPSAFASLSWVKGKPAINQPLDAEPVPKKDWRDNLPMGRYQMAALWYYWGGDGT